MLGRPIPGIDHVNHKRPDRFAKKNKLYFHLNWLKTAFRRNDFLLPEHFELFPPPLNLTFLILKVMLTEVEC